ncbi:MAG: (2Fe-2S) ferredoxin domain-containing protein [Myxococcota bacterium]
MARLVNTDGTPYKRPVQPRFVVLVCQNVRSPTDERGCCKLRGSDAILERLKALRRERKLGSLFRATSTGCLGGCAAGPTVVVARNGGPDDRGDVVTYSGFRTDDVERLIDEHLVGGVPIERLIAKPEWLD